MSTATHTRPSLLRPSLFAVTWHVCTWGGWALLLWSGSRLSPAAFAAMGLPLLMIAAVVALGELRPIIMTRLDGNPVSISLAFVFAVMYVWGFAPAALLNTGAVLMSELMQRKAPWKIAFNIGQDVCSLAAAWLVMRAAGVDPTPLGPQTDLSVSDLWWIAASWVVYHLVNLALVSGLAEDDGLRWSQSFADEFWFYSASAMAVLALSPLIAVVAVAYPSSWTFLPLLLLPLIAVYKAAEMWRLQEHRALHDPLTGLPNRVLLTDRIEQALARSSRAGGRVVVVFLDVDLFKVVNDSLGHEAGDSLLKEIAARLRAAVRPGDTLARFGGDEFVAVCEGVATPEARSLANRITSALREPFMFGGREVPVTASSGVALASPVSEALTLLRDADAALYRAKERGRDRVVVFDDTIHRQAAERLDDEVGLPRALMQGELRTHFQPVVDVTTGGTVGFEALLRWQDPKRGLLAPDQFLRVADESGLIVPIGYWILEDALTCWRRWCDEIPSMCDQWVSVNLSARQLVAPFVVERLAECLQRTGVPATALRLEITESDVMRDFTPVVHNLTALRSLGLSIALDDFGTGYSSLTYLKRLPVSVVKIDRSFVDGLGDPDDGTDEPIVDAIVKMATALHLEVIAEGVETQTQLDVLRRLGGRLAQGFLWSRPMPAPDVPDWLAKRHGQRIDVR